MSTDHRQIERTASIWLARRDAGGWSDRQQTALNAWLAESVAHRVAFLRLQAAWEETARLKAFAAGGSATGVPARGEWAHSPYFASPVGGDLPARFGRDARKHGRRRWPLFAGIAASLLAIAAVAGGLAWSHYTRVETGAWRTALGAQQVVQLPDGSTATLGSDTGLRMAFSRSERDLDLARGEAFFDVAHDAARPFVVHVEGYRVTAVGTRFDVRRGHDDKLRVVVTRGLVRLQSTNDPAQAGTMLPAGSIAMIDDTDVLVQQVPLDEARERLSWRDGYAVFHGTPLAEAVGEFNRYNARKIVIADPSLDALRVGGNFRLDNSAAFVRLMQEVFPVQAAQHGDRIVLSRKTPAKSAR
ncbi:MAG TPA: FecR domain-containing protein [Rhodanobacteraceae bacterium]|nr:FecR domain-containing protein [Rhodanobacteraceae bacterium]